MENKKKSKGSCRKGWNSTKYLVFFLLAIASLAPISYAACSVTNCKWSSTNTVVEGTTINLQATFSGCSGKTLSAKIYDFDYVAYGDDLVDTLSWSISSDGSKSKSWTTFWTEDGGATDNPEYGFKIFDGTSQKCSSYGNGELIVTKAECTSGACCDTNTKKYKSSSTTCATATELSCYWGNDAGDDVAQRTKTTYCSGSSSSCSGTTSYSSWTTYESCSSSQKCQNNDCVSACTSNYEKKCYSGNVYWYDSCGNRGDLYTTCTSNQDCNVNSCVTKSGCQYSNPSCGSGYDCVSNQCVQRICQINNVYWSTSSATEGDSVTMTIETNSNCEGKSVNFDIYENDDTSPDDYMATKTATVSGSRATATWTTVWVTDCILGLCGDPEFYFTASVDGKSKTSSDMSVAKKSGCQYNNPACSSDYDCISNQCVKKSGCQYSNPSCGSDYDCISNQCVKKSGCQYSNPACSSDYNCVSNQCVKKSGCQYSNPSCGSDYDCISNQCVKKSGCQYNNPSCATNQDCINNMCVTRPNCQITSVYWSKTSATEGDSVTMTIETNSDCNGKSVSFSIYENDDTSADDLTASASATISGGKATASWTTVWVTDCILGLCGDPEFYFTATVDGKSKSTTDMPVVKKPLPICTVTDCKWAPSGNVNEGSVASIQGTFSGCIGRTIKADIYDIDPPLGINADDYAASVEWINQQDGARQVTWAAIWYNDTDGSDSDPEYVFRIMVDGTEKCRASNELDVKKVGCQYNNPSCATNQDCINNVCVTKVNCQIISVYWSKSSATEGDSVTMTIETNSDCNGKSVSFSIYENDDTSADDFTASASATVSNGKATATWTTVWVTDCILGLCGDPEFYFTATVDGKSKTTSDMSVAKKLVPTCTINSVAWSMSNAIEGDKVSLIVETSNCDGKQANFSIYEDDTWPLADDFVEFGTTTVSNGKAVATWNVKWVDDGLAGDPEYYFTVSIDGKTKDSIDMGVSKATINKTSCNISNVGWSTSQAVEGDRVTLSAMFGAGCAGSLINFTIYEDDAWPLADDYVDSIIGVAYPTVAPVTWVVKWTDDGIAGNPEYYFTVEAGGSKISSANMEVTKKSVEDCKILSASWSKSNASDGDSVTMIIMTNGCDGKQANFSIYEDDTWPLPDDYATSKTVTVSGGKATSSWIAAWQKDCINDLCGNPEYYFEAKIADKSMTSGQFDVGPKILMTEDLKEFLLANPPKMEECPSYGTMSYECMQKMNALGGNYTEITQEDIWDALSIAWIASCGGCAAGIAGMSIGAATCETGVGCVAGYYSAIFALGACDLCVGTGTMSEAIGFAKIEVASGVRSAGITKVVATEEVALRSEGAEIVSKQATASGGKILARIEGKIKEVWFTLTKSGDKVQKYSRTSTVGDMERDASDYAIKYLMDRPKVVFPQAAKESLAQIYKLEKQTGMKTEFASDEVAVKGLRYFEGNDMYQLVPDLLGKAKIKGENIKTRYIYQVVTDKGTVLPGRTNINSQGVGTIEMSADNVYKMLPNVKLTDGELKLMNVHSTWAHEVGHGALNVRFGDGFMDKYPAAKNIQFGEYLVDLWKYKNNPESIRAGQLEIDKGIIDWSIGRVMDNGLGNYAVVRANAIKVGRQSAVTGWDQVLTARLRDEGKDPAPILAKVDELTQTIITTGDKIIGDESIGASSQTFSSLLADVSTRTFALAGLASVVVNAQDTGNQESVTNTQTCATIWSCSDWSDCVNGIQTRTCNSANNCKSNMNVITSTSRKCTATTSGSGGTISANTVNSQEIKPVLPDTKPNDSVCTLDYTPVCGADSQTYSNRCTAESKGVKVAYDGKCKDIEVNPPVANNTEIVNPPSQEPANITQTDSSTWTVAVNQIGTNTNDGTAQTPSSKNWTVVVVKR